MQSILKIANNTIRIILKKARIRSRNKSVWETYTQLRATFDRNPSDDNAKALQNFVGTTSDFRDVVAAMESEFDADFYLLVNEDVRASGMEGYFHYLLWGWKENRTPSKFFEPAYYRTVNQDLTEREFPLAHYITKGRKTGRAAHPVSDKLWFEPFIPSQEMWENAIPAKRVENTRAVVIMPVYKGYEETLTAIYRALASRGDDRYSLLVVNDKSPDELLSDKLSGLAASNLFDYYDSPTNRGFVQTINYALMHLSGQLDVVLLNSDAYVFPGWFNRLIKHADADADVATITPLSNNATICSYPMYNRDNYHALEMSPHELDQLAARVNLGLSVEAPTGVGFCFYMRRSAVEKVGPLDDQAFKLGYGEENDFCMRALNAGMKNLIAGDVFVFHTGSVSFSSSKEENYTQGQLNLSKKHPNYGSLVANHVQADPELPLRRNLDSARLIEALRGCTLIVSHKWSGGIETYLAHLRKDLHSRGKRCVTLRVYDLHYALLEAPGKEGVFTPNLQGIDLRTEWDFLFSLLKDLAPELLHINSMAGLMWPWQKKMLEAFSDLGPPITFVGHDYSPISHHYQLIRPDNAFVGVPNLDTLEKWASIKDTSGSFDACSPRERHSTYSSFFGKGIRVEVPSNSTKEIYELAFPEINIQVVPHRDHLPETTIATRRTEDGRLRIAVVGAIGKHKGSDVLAGLATHSRNQGLPIDYHLIGYSNDDDYLASQGVSLWGRYGSEQDALNRLQALQPDLFFIPSIWPETYCYALSMAFKKRIPPVVFDLGAQSERVSAIEWGVVAPIRLSTNPSGLSEFLTSLPIDELWEKRRPFEVQVRKAS